MSIEQQAIDIRTEIERGKVAWTDYPLEIEYDNRDAVDLSALLTPYLMVDILWGDGVQMDLGQRPMVADIGSIILAAGVKEGQGTVGLLKLLQHFRAYLQLRHPLGSIKTKAAMLGGRPVLLRGFYYQTMTIPFWSQNLAPLVP